MSKRTRWSDRGQVVPLLAVLVAGAALVALLVVARLGAVVRDRAEARTAADAGALAGVLGGEEAARRVVEENGAVVVSIRRMGADVEVRARWGDAEATSVATRGSAASAGVPVDSRGAER